MMLLAILGPGEAVHGVPATDEIERVTGRSVAVEPAGVEVVRETRPMTNALRRGIEPAVLERP